MFDTPKTREEARKHRYNKWGGNPNGTRYNEERCAYEVHERGRGILFYQCQFKHGHGPDKLYCKIHANKITQMESLNKELDNLD